MPRIKREKKELTAEQKAEKKQQAVEREHARAQSAFSAILSLDETIARENVCHTTLNLWRERLNAFRKKGEKVKLADFLACSEQVDPFNADAPSHRAMAEWFFEQWRYWKPDARTVHVRALHYAIIKVAGTSDHICLPNGDIYDNQKTRWMDLQRAGKYARYLNLIGPAVFEDKRSRDAIVAGFSTEQRSLSIHDDMYEFESFGLSDLPDFPDMPDLPDFPELPRYYLTLQGQQRYRIEVWIEKSTQDDVVKSVCQRYGVTLVVAQGEISISSMWEAINRAERYGRKTSTVILYVSDFDPAGKSMPVAAARKLEYLRMLRQSSVNMRLYPIALTYDQCVQYQLPRTPIKSSDNRRGSFEGRYGSGATELDALEAEHPGKLAELIEQAILNFRDSGVSHRVNRAWAEWRELLASIEQDVATHYGMQELRAAHEQAEEELELIREQHDEYEGAYLEFVAQYDQNVRRRFNRWYETYFQPLHDRLEEAMHAVKSDMEARMPDIEQVTIPEAEEVIAGTTCLYDSERSYIQQLAAYKLFAGKFAHLEDGEETVCDAADD